MEKNFYLELASLLINILSVIAAGLGIYFGYKKYTASKLDEVADAAGIIIVEIDKAEQEIRNIRSFKEFTFENARSMEVIPLDSYNGWDTYKHLFIKKLNHSEFVAVENFYKNARLLQTEIDRLKKSLPDQIESKAHFIQETIIKFAIDSIEECGDDSTIDAMKNTFDNKLDKFNKIISPHAAWFTPNDIVNQISWCVANYLPIQGTTAYSKLRTCANLE